MKRRTAVVALGLAAACGAARAQDAAARPLRIVVPYPPGGSADLLARALATRMSADLGQTVIVDNKPGAGTALGAREVAAAAGDGNTLLMGTVTSHAMNPALSANVGYDPVRGFTPIAPLATIPFALLVRAGLPARSLAEFVALARARPGELTVASAGVGTSNHLAAELLQSMAGIRLNHVPYKGSAPALNDLLGGHVDAMFDLVLTATKHVGGSAVRALAVTSRQRSPQLPGVPTVAEQGFAGYEVSAWFGLFGPAGVAPAAVERLHGAARRAVRSAEVSQWLGSSGAEPLDGTPAEFAALVQTDLRRWGTLIRERGIQAAP